MNLFSSAKEKKSFGNVDFSRQRIQASVGAFFLQLLVKRTLLLVCLLLAIGALVAATIVVRAFFSSPLPALPADPSLKKINATAVTSVIQWRDQLAHEHGREIQVSSGIFYHPPVSTPLP